MTTEQRLCPITNTVEQCPSEALVNWGFHYRSGVEVTHAYSVKNER